MEIIKDKILKTVKKKKIKITEFAKEIGMSRAAIYNLTDETIKYSTIKKIANYLDVPVSDLINDDAKTKIKTGVSKQKKESAKQLNRLLNKLASVHSEFRKEFKKINR